MPSIFVGEDQSMPSSVFQYRPYHFNDIRLFLILIPCIAAINYYLTDSNIRLNWFLVINFSIDVQQGYVGWYCCRMVILYLDVVYPYSRSAAKRIILQTALSSVAGVVVIVLQTMLMNYLFTDHPMPLSFFTLDMIIIAIWFLVVNGIYIGLHYYTEWQRSEEQRKREGEIRSQGFMVKLGRKNVIVPYTMMTGFKIEDEYAVLKTNDKKNYVVDESLDAIEKKVPAEQFFRLNRQLIVNREIISGFERTENGKINVFLKSEDHFPASVPVSRLRAAAFKSWFQPENGVGP